MKALILFTVFACISSSQANLVYDFVFGITGLPCLSDDSNFSGKLDAIY